MNDLGSSISKITTSLKELSHFLSKHRVIIIIFIGALAVLLALFQTRSYLNPSRNEDIYTERSAEINYQGIDDEIVQKLQSTQGDEEIQVDSNFVPNRNNPFSE